MDFGMCSGCASLLGRWSNITFDSVSLEGLGFGAVGALSGDRYSILNAGNIWFFNATRCACVCVVARVCVAQASHAAGTPHACANALVARGPL